MIKKFQIYIIGIWCLVLGIFPAFAQEEEVSALSKQIVEAKTNEDTFDYFEQLADLYFTRPAIKSEGGIPPEAGKENKYNEFVEFLNSLLKEKKALEPVINYYLGLARYYQLKHLEEAQSWDEYFSKGNAYREELVNSLKKTVGSSAPGDLINVFSKLVLWKFHKDQEDSSSEEALTDLMNSALALKNPLPLKDIADELMTYAERSKAKQLYKIYVDKIIAQGLKDEELAGIADNFYQEGNLDLAQNIYDAYLERIIKSKPKEEVIPILKEIGKKFAYKDGGPYDVFYAEAVFKKIDELGTGEIFDADTLYLRAYNLEKAKDYPNAADFYLELLRRFPDSAHADEIDYKLGIIYAYILRDINSGKSHFEKLAQKEKISPQVISGLYQLGLLMQWEGETSKAKDYYQKLMEKAKSGFTDTVNLAQERLKEIEENKPIEYNLRTFLDISLGPTFNGMGRPILSGLKGVGRAIPVGLAPSSKGVGRATPVGLDLRSHPYSAGVNQDVEVRAGPYTTESGCMPVELQYLWSGHLGGAKISAQQPLLSTQFSSPGTKEIFLVVVSSVGAVDRGLDLIDVK